MSGPVLCRVSIIPDILRLAYPSAAGPVTGGDSTGDKVACHIDMLDTPSLHRRHCAEHCGYTMSMGDKDEIPSCDFTSAKIL
mmetsp:Transcript_67559/g.124325  ORF Transcript_67559/g.124325 Transcript_67559/m.124325 type:complete len:82 (-) Transcript_67559:382-627(-)